MKEYIKILFFACSVSYAQQPTSGLIAYYDFNRDIQGDSTRIYDKSGNQNHGTVIGTVMYTADRFGVSCSALWFDGNTYVTVRSSRSLKSPRRQLTITVWFRIAHGADFFRQWITICCKGDQSYESSDCPQYRMQATAQTISINTDFTEIVIPQIKYETWYFYAYTFDGSVVRAYLDGQKFFEMNYSGILEPNDMPLEIGRDRPGALEYYYGAMDDLRIYDRALSERELYQLYNDRPDSNTSDRCSNSNVGSILMQPPPSPPHNPQPKPIKSVSDSTSSPSVRADSMLPKPNLVVQDPFAGLPRTSENNPVNYQKIVYVSSRDVTFYPYDNDVQDGDIVSININGVWVKDYYELKIKNASPRPADIIRCSLNPGDNNYLITKAWNVGTHPPNTLTVEINDDTTIHKVTINSDIGLSGGIRIVVKN